MANEKTINLAGSEVEVKISGQNCDIRNDGTDIVYASRKANVVGGEDGVVSIPAGQAVKLLGTWGTLYLLGTGSVQLCGNDYAELVFKTSAAASGEGGGVDEVARNAINTHAGNADIHLTAEKAIEAAATAISNDNCLINPNFKINQRGKSVYNGIGAKQYTVDGWYMDNGTVTVEDDGVVLEAPNATTLASMRQSFENFADYGGKIVTVSLDCDLLTEGCRLFLQFKRNGAWSEQGAPFTAMGRCAVSRTIIMPDEITDQLEFAIMLHTPTSDVVSKAKLYSVKIEIGSVATPFVPPNPAIEMIKCQRYYQLRTTNAIDPADLRPTMATIKDIKQREDGNYEYIAEL